MNRAVRNLAFTGAAIFTIGGLASWSVDTVSAQSPAAGSMAQAPSKSTIRALQEALNKQGIAVGMDGILGAKTRNAIKKYQSQHHLPVTGEPDKATLDKLGVVAAPGATGPAATTSAQGAAGSGPGSMGSGMMQQGHGMMGSGTMQPGQGAAGQGMSPGQGMPQR